MTHTNCSFHGGPAHGTKHMVADATRKVSFSQHNSLEAVQFIPRPQQVSPEPTRVPIHTYERSAVSPSRFIYQGEDGKPFRPVTFTRYLMPDGRRTTVTIDCPHDVADKADQLHSRNLVLECEVLRTGEVSLTITDQEEEDVDIRVVPNGPAVPEAVYDLVREFDIDAFRRGHSDG